MKRLYLVFFFTMFSFINTIKSQGKYEGICFENIFLSIKFSKWEYERQVEMLNKQVINVALEEKNQKEWTKFNEITDKIHTRLSFMPDVIKGFVKEKNFVRDVKEIRNNQQDILKEIKTAPEHIRRFLPKQIGFEKELDKTYKLAVGIVGDQIAGKAVDKLGEELAGKIDNLEELSGIMSEVAGETIRLAKSVASGITSMEIADRKMLVDILIEKVRKLRIQSTQMLETIRIFKMNKNAEKYRLYYTNNDKQIIEAIMAEYKSKF